jgi:thiol:disulfide interchange protein DsbD
MLHGLISLLVLFIQATPLPSDGQIELAAYQDQHLTVAIRPAKSRSSVGLALEFRCPDDLHLYADPATSPNPQSALQVKVTAQGVRFDRPIIPPARSIYDKAQDAWIRVLSGDFSVFVPVERPPTRPFVASVTISGAACTSQVCLPPFTKTIELQADLTGQLPLIEIHEASATGHLGPTLIYLVLAVVAGLSINLMPCVLPVIPLIVLRLARQSASNTRQRLLGAAALCAGIISFFALLATLSAVFTLATGAISDIHGLFRYQAGLIALFLGLVFFALLLFDVFTIDLPAGLTERLPTPDQAAGAFWTGFLAAILSIPCSGALLGSVLVWAQAQPLLLGCLTIILLGVGMALPYGLLAAIPALVAYIPRPGRWMDIFKKSCGFLVLLIAVKLVLPALPKDRLIGLISFGVIFAFCVWFWAIGIRQVLSRAIRWGLVAIMAVLMVTTGLLLLSPPQSDPIAWQPYDRQLIQKAQDEGRAVLLKFTADWCTNCSLVDRLIYRDKVVSSMIRQKDILPIKADTTMHDSAATIDLIQVYGQAGAVPVSIFLSPSGDMTILRGIFSKDRLLQLLETLPERGSS